MDNKILDIFVPDTKWHIQQTFISLIDIYNDIHFGFLISLWILEVTDILGTVVSFIKVLSTNKFCIWYILRCG